MSDLQYPDWQAASGLRSIREPQPGHLGSFSRYPGGY